MANPKQMFSSEEVRILLLEQRNEDFHQTLVRVESKIDDLDKKFDAKMDALEQKFDLKIGALNQKFDAKMDALEQKFDLKIDALNQKFDAKIDSHFKWTLGLISGLYATNIATLITMLGKAYDWF